MSIANNFRVSGEGIKLKQMKYTKQYMYIYMFANVWETSVQSQVASY